MSYHAKKIKGHSLVSITNAIFLWQSYTYLITAITDSHHEHGGSLKLEPNIFINEGGGLIRLYLAINSHEYYLSITNTSMITYFFKSANHSWGLLEIGGFCFEGFNEAVKAILSNETTMIKSNH